MTKYLNIVVILLLGILIVTAILYWTTGKYYPISGVALVLLIIITGAIQRNKKKDYKN